MFFLPLCLCAPLIAQTPISWGAKLGFNLSQHYGTKDQQQGYSVKTGLRPGVTGGAYLDLEILPNFSLGYELLYSMKGSAETIGISSMEIDEVMEELPKPAEMKVKYYLDYMEVPILLKVKVLDKPGYGITALTGTAMALKIKGYHTLKGTVYFLNGNDYSLINISEESKLAGVNMFDYSFIYGGMLQLKTKIPLNIEYRFTLGWDYLSLPTYEFFEPVQLRNQTYSLILSSQF